VSNNLGLIYCNLGYVFLVSWSAIYLSIIDPQQYWKFNCESKG
jgi:hypothetical protein